MKKIPIMYTSKQVDEITNALDEKYNTTSEFIAHEITSEYVHTDIYIGNVAEDERVYATFGMGARKTASPLETYQRIELVMFSSRDFDIKSRESGILDSQLVALSKYPFENDSWFGPGHTINADDNFKETFGYDAFVFAADGFPYEVSKLGTIRPLIAIPVYQDEVDWMIRNSSMDFLEQFCKSDCFNTLVDKERPHFLPDEPECDDGEETNIDVLMSLFGLTEEQAIALEKELDTIEHLRNEGEKFYEAFMELLGKYMDIEE